MAAPYKRKFFRSGEAAPKSATYSFGSYVTLDDYQIAKQGASIDRYFEEGDILHYAADVPPLNPPAKYLLWFLPDLMDEE